jgi:hypothetical protein
MNSSGSMKNAARASHQDPSPGHTDHGNRAASRLGSSSNNRHQVVDVPPRNDHDRVESKGTARNAAQSMQRSISRDGRHQENHARIHGNHNSNISNAHARPASAANSNARWQALDGNRNVDDAYSHRSYAGRGTHHGGALQATPPSRQAAWMGGFSGRQVRNFSPIFEYSSFEREQQVAAYSKASIIVFRISGINFTKCHRQVLKQYIHTCMYMCVGFSRSHI